MTASNERPVQAQLVLASAKEALITAFAEAAKSNEWKEDPASAVTKYANLAEGTAESLYNIAWAHGFEAAFKNEKSIGDPSLEEMKAQTERLEADTAENRARLERFQALSAKRNYQTEIHSVSINVLVAMLTKDALRAIRDEGYSSVPKLNIEEIVDFSLIVGKRYVDEMHKIQVSDKQVTEYKEYLNLSQPIDPGLDFRTQAK